LYACEKRHFVRKKSTDWRHYETKDNTKGKRIGQVVVKVVNENRTLLAKTEAKGRTRFVRKLAVQRKNVIERRMTIKISQKRHCHSRTSSKVVTNSAPQRRSSLISAMSKCLPNGCVHEREPGRLMRIAAGK